MTLFQEMAVVDLQTRVTIIAVLLQVGIILELQVALVAVTLALAHQQPMEIVTLAVMTVGALLAPQL